MEENNVVGRYFGTSDELEAIYLDYSNYHEYVRIYDVNNPSVYDVIPMALNDKTGNYEPIVDFQNKTNGWLCGTLCALGTIAIAFSDGPVPAMDVLAATYAVTCLADCATK